MLRAVRCASTWTRQGWFKEAEAIRDQIETLTWKAYRDGNDKNGIQSSWDKINERIKTLNNAKCQDGAPQFKKEMIEEMRESANRIQNVFKRDVEK